MLLSKKLYTKICVLRQYDNFSVNIRGYASSSLNILFAKDGAYFAQHHLQVGPAAFHFVVRNIAGLMPPFTVSLSIPKAKL